MAARSQGASHEVENFGGPIWLLQDCERSRGTGALPDPDIEPAADEDDREHVAAAAHPFEPLDPAHSRHLDVEDQTVAIISAARIEKFPTGREFSDFKAVAFEQKPKRIPHPVIIVYDENHRPFPARNSLPLLPG